MADASGVQEYVEGRLAEHQSRLHEEGYVTRSVFTEGADPQLARLRRMWSPESRTEAPECREEGELDLLPRVVVIGSAGAGKSFLLANRYCAAAQTHLADASQPAPLWLDLPQDLGTDLSIEGALRRTARAVWDLCEERQAKVSLFLDTLDEILAGLAQPVRFIRDLEGFLAGHDDTLAHVMVGCRRHAWAKNYLTGCAPAFEVYQVDSLSYDEYGQIIPDDDELARFFGRCEELGIRDLLDTAFDGFYLAREFARGNPLPGTRLELLHRRTMASLRAAQAGPGFPPSPGTERLAELAGQLACVATFTDRTSWDATAVRDVLTTDIHPGVLQPATQEEIEWLLRQPLFRGHADAFSFTHDLYREYLAAKALEGVSLGKQRQLVEAGARLGRIATVNRGVATALAGISAGFRDWLLENDPVVAFLGETPDLPRDADEALTRRVMDTAVEREEAPWFGLPPRDETLEAALPKHRPNDVGSLVTPYLQDPREIARIWGTACAAAWGGDGALNPALSDLAHDTAQHTGIRRNAVDAMVASGEDQPIEALFDLLDDQDDRVRGAVLQVYRERTSPSPTDFIEKLLGGATDDSLLCVLQMETLSYGERLNVAELREAFASVDRHFDALSNLRAHLLQGLLKRAVETDSYDIPPSLIVRIWSVGGLDIGRHRHQDELGQLLTASHCLFGSVWQYCLDTIDSERDDVYRGDARRRLGEAADDHIFDLVPPDSTALTQPQFFFIEQALSAHFHKHPTARRLHFFQESAPAFTSRLQLPSPPSAPPERNWAAEEEYVFDRMELAAHSAVGQGNNLLLAIAEIEDMPLENLSVQKVAEVLERLGPALQRRARTVFRPLVEAVRYGRKPVPGVPNQLRMTRDYYSIPFWYLRDRGESFPPDKVAEIIRCYGFRHGDDARYVDLLEELRERDESVWQETVRALLEDPLSSPHKLVDHLVETNEDFYLPRCGERLCNGWVHANHLLPLLQYWRHFRPDDYIETLRSCYSCLRDRLAARDDVSYTEGGRVPVEVLPDLADHHRWCDLLLLLMLMEVDDGWAWQEFENLLRLRNVPIGDQETSWWGWLPEWHEMPDRARALADWYALVRRRSGAEHLPCRSRTSWLLQSMREVGGLEGALRELERLRRDRAFSGAQWLSAEIADIEHEILWAPRAKWEPHDLLKFVNSARYRVVHEEVDLWECVCDAIEDIQRELGRGDGVDGYWDAEEPKQEVGCQNVLWPRLRDKLDNWGVTNVAERHIGPNLCDFWVEKPRANADPLRVVVELKTARQGYGRRELVDPMETQLWETYMAPADCRHGIHVVLWFKDEAGYPYPSAWDSPEDLLTGLEERAKQVGEARHVSIATYVLDVSAQPRG